MISESAGSGAAYISFFLIGLALNLTPCVYPMLSVTVSLFGTQKSAHPMTAFLKALVYVLGMATLYTAMGAGAALTGGFFGAALQSKIVLLGLSALFLGLSLSLFGVYSLQAPQWLLARLGHQNAVKAGFAACYFYGLAAGLFAAPCVGPPIIALLTLVGAKGDLTYAVSVFFVMALGLGFPYLLIGTFTGLLHRLPRSGVWLLWVDHLFGTVLLGVAGFYTCLALYPGGLAYFIPAAAAAGGLYLGFFDPAGSEKKLFRIFKRAFGLGFIVLAAALWPMPQKTHLHWQPYSAEKITEAAKGGKPVFLDFYADWCIPCHELDRFTFSDGRVQAAAASFELLRVDMTNPESEGAQKLIEKFDIQGVPTLLFLDRQGKEAADLRVSGFIEAETLLSILKDARLAPAVSDIPEAV